MSELMKERLKVAVLNAGGQPDYLYGFVSGIANANVDIEIVDGDKTVNSFKKYRNVTHLNYKGSVHQASTSAIRKSIKLFKYYLRLIIFPFITKSKIFHIQWENKFVVFDRTILILWYKLFGKHIVYTAHNVNPYSRDGNGNVFKEKSLSFLYNKVDKIIVHTSQMRDALINQFNIDSSKISICLHGINNFAQGALISKNDARIHLNVKGSKKVILFFGQVGYYKGLDILLESINELIIKGEDVFLIIRGRPKNCKEYVDECLEIIRKYNLYDKVDLKFDFIPHSEVDIIFQAADVVCLPYRSIFQSGVVFMALKYGVPMIATDVGNFKEDILMNENGMLAKEISAESLSTAFIEFFKSQYYLNPDIKSRIIKDAKAYYSWDKIGMEYIQIYENLYTFTS